MVKRFLFIIFLFVFIWLPTTGFTQSQPINNGLSWLTTNQNSDGSIGNITSTTDITRTTAFSNGIKFVW